MKTIPYGCQLIEEGDIKSVVRRAITPPLYSRMSDSDVQCVIKILKNSL